MQGVRTASLSSPLPLESLFDGEKAAEVQVSLGFKSTHGHSALLKSSSQVNGTNLIESHMSIFLVNEHFAMLYRDHTLTMPSYWPCRTATYCLVVIITL